MPIEVIDKIKPKNGGKFPVAEASDIEHNGKRLPEFLDKIGEGGSLPPVTADDNGKVLRVVDGSWAAAELPQYDGETEVVPRTSEQVLETAGKMVQENISVSPIPYAEVSNNSGGKTVTIGG